MFTSPDTAQARSFKESARIASREAAARVTTLKARAATLKERAAILVEAGRAPRDGAWSRLEAFAASIEWAVDVADGEDAALEDPMMLAVGMAALRFAAMLHDCAAGRVPPRLENLEGAQVVRDALLALTREARDARLN